MSDGIKVEPRQSGEALTLAGGPEATVAVHAKVFPFAHLAQDPHLELSDLLGATPYRGGVHFALQTSAAATGVTYVIPDMNDLSAPPREFKASRSEHGVWLADVPDVKPGQLYALRVDGPSDEGAGLHFDPQTLLADPNASGVVHRNGQLWSVVMPAEPINLHASPLVSHDPAQVIIYETHVKSLSVLMNELPPDMRGTYAALGSEQIAAYLKDLGINMLELLPVQFHVNEKFLADARLNNYWGYNLGSFYALHPYSASNEPEAARRELQDAIRALAGCNIGVIFDVPYGHTAEGMKDCAYRGGMISWNGIDPDFYLHNGDGSHANFTGCGNTLNINHEPAADQVISSLRYLARVFGCCGFRFDQATILGREADGRFNGEHHFLRRILGDRVLQQISPMLIAEPWDCAPADCYGLGRFPGKMKEWCGPFRDDVYYYWEGQGTPGRLAEAICGSRRLGKPSPLCMINYITCHDGYTLGDKVAHDEYWIRRCRNMMLTLLTARGTPMLLGGDEFLRSQKGNHNAYDQDNEISYFDWKLAPHQVQFRELTKAGIDLRLSEPALRRPGYHPDGLPDVIWYAPDGRSTDQLDTGFWNRTSDRALGVHWLGRCSGQIGAHGEPLDGDDILEINNPDPQIVPFKMPQMADKAGVWKLIFDTSLSDPFSAQTVTLSPGETYPSARNSKQAFRFVPA